MFLPGDLICPLQNEEENSVRRFIIYLWHAKQFLHRPYIGTADKILYYNDKTTLLVIKEKDKYDLITVLLNGIAYSAYEGQFQLLRTV